MTPINNPYYQTNVSQNMSGLCSIDSLKGGKSCLEYIVNFFWPTQHLDRFIFLIIVVALIIIVWKNSDIFK